MCSIDRCPRCGSVEITPTHDLITCLWFDTCNDCGYTTTPTKSYDQESTDDPRRNR